MTLQSGVFLTMYFLFFMVYGMVLVTAYLDWSRMRRLRRAGRLRPPFLSSTTNRVLVVIFGLVGLPVMYFSAYDTFVHRVWNKDVSLGGLVGFVGLCVGIVISLALFWLGRFLGAKRTRSPSSGNP